MCISGAFRSRVVQRGAAVEALLRDSAETRSVIRFLLVLANVQNLENIENHCVIILNLLSEPMERRLLWESKDNGVNYANKRNYEKAVLILLVSRFNTRNKEFNERTILVFSDCAKSLERYTLVPRHCNKYNIHEAGFESKILFFWNTFTNFEHSQVDIFLI